MPPKKQARSTTAQSAATVKPSTTDVTRRATPKAARAAQLLAARMTPRTVCDAASDDDTATVELILEDVTTGMSALLDGALDAHGLHLGGFHDDAIGPLSNDGWVAVAWTFVGHDTKGFWGLAPSGREVVVNGITVAAKHGGRTAHIHRYIDWLDVAAQLGLGLSGRVPIDPTGEPRAREPAQS